MLDEVKSTGNKALCFRLLVLFYEPKGSILLSSQEKATYRWKRNDSKSILRLGSIGLLTYKKRSKIEQAFKDVKQCFALERFHLTSLQMKLLERLSGDLESILLPENRIIYEAILAQIEIIFLQVAIE